MHTHNFRKQLLWKAPLTALIAGLTACGGNTSTKTETQTVADSNATISYTWNQKVFCLNMLSNISAHFGHDKGITDSTGWAVNTVLAYPGVQQCIGQWTCVWGPRVIYSLTEHIPANTMFIARQGTTNNYVVAIAGTDPASRIAEIFEDANVLTAPLWEYGKDHPLARLSKGTSDGLKALISMSDNGKGAREYLGTLTKDGGTINIWVTGHSLGGFLSPTYALYLSDTKKDWVGKGTANINCLAVAGATPGNDAFAKHYENQLGQYTTRVWNTLDVVPHAYQPDMLQQIPTIYSTQNPADSLPPKLLGLNSKDVIKGLETVGKTWNYTQLTPSTVVGFTSEMYTQAADDSFFNQMLAQHIPAYPTFFGVDSFQYAVMRAVNLSSPFFTNGNTPRTPIKSYDTSGKNFNNMNP